MTIYYLSLGANLGDREATLGRAIALLRQNEHITVLKVSSLYKTPPWGKKDQPYFINGAAAVQTDIDALKLLDICLDIERQLGRVRHEKWGARVIDIDIVYSTGVEYHTDRLHIPNPYVTGRAFVLVPLQEIAPDLIIKGQSVSQWIQALEDVAAIQKI